MPKKSDVVVPLPQKLVVGGIAGIIGTCVIFPLDIVKTRLQNQVIDPVKGPEYRGFIHGFKRILAKEGVSGLYRGLGANLIGVTPEKALKLAVNDLVREYFTKKNGDGKIKLWQEIAAGGTAGFTQVSITNPMEIVKIRMQTMALQPGPQQSTMEVVRGLGISGLYRGVGVTWMRDIPFSFLFFPLYANLSKFGVAEDQDAGMAQILAAGGVSGSFSAALCTPMDVVKTRLQVKGGMAEYGSIGNCFKRVYAEEGFGAFFKGVGPRMIVQAPLFGIALLCFEVQKRYLMGTL